MTEQQHPLYSRDREILNTLFQEGLNDYNLAELARLKIRYSSFPGARDIQADLEKLLQKWQLSEAQLYQQTRQLHAKTRIYQVGSNKREEEDWS